MISIIGVLAVLVLIVLAGVMTLRRRRHMWDEPPAADDEDDEPASPTGPATGDAGVPTAEAAAAHVAEEAPGEPAADLPPPAPPEAISDPGHVLQGISEIRAFFRKNETPIYFVSATAFNLLGIDRWVRNFTFLNWFDSFDGTHPNVFVPKERGYHEFESIEEIVNHLLGHKEVADLVEGRGGRGKACFLMFDEETEANLEALGLELAFPSAALRTHLDSKIVTTQLGNEAGVPSVPNVLGQAADYDELLALAAAGGLGSDLVVQTPYGDSGQTTFFIASAADWDGDADKIVGEPIKVMRRIEPREAAVEGVVTRHGTLVGPVMTELAGFPELTPYGGGWCGNEVGSEFFSDHHRELARRYTQQMGDRLRQEGYRGYFELDFLVDAVSGELYLGELNPRVTGASSMTNVTAVAYGDMPLFLFHLLEFMDVDYEIDVAELNTRWAKAQNVDAWSQFILKQVEEDVERITEAPPSGIWRMSDAGAITYVRRDTDWHTVGDEREAFYLRIADAGGYRYPGADLGILVTRGRFMDDEHELGDRARGWIEGIKRQFRSVPIEDQQAVETPTPEPFGFKML
jgi:biotin carboxylase